MVSTTFVKAVLRIIWDVWEARLRDRYASPPTLVKGAFLGPGARLLDRTRLPTKEPGKPARVGERSRVGGNAVVCGGIIGGKRARSGPGECDEGQGALEGSGADDVPTCER